MKNTVQLAKTMYPCQDVPVVILGKRCNPGCLYCDLCTRQIPEGDIICSGINNVVTTLANYKGAYFSPVTDCLLDGNEQLTLQIVTRVWAQHENFVPLVVTKQVISTAALDVFEANKHRIVVQVSIPSVNEALVQLLEPGSATVQERLDSIRALTDRGIPVLGVIMPWFDVYGEGETIDDLPRALAENGLERVLAGSAVLPDTQRQRLLGTNDPLILQAILKFNNSQQVATKTGAMLPLKARLLAFSKLIHTFGRHGVLCKVCSADNPDVAAVAGDMCCAQFRHSKFLRSA